MVNVDTPKTLLSYKAFRVFLDRSNQTVVRFFDTNLEMVIRKILPPDAEINNTNFNVLCKLVSQQEPIVGLVAFKSTNRNGSDSRKVLVFDVSYYGIITILAVIEAPKEDNLFGQGLYFNRYNRVKDTITIHGAYRKYYFTLGIITRKIECKNFTLDIDRLPVDHMGIPLELEKLTGQTVDQSVLKETNMADTINLNTESTKGNPTMSNIQPAYTKILAQDDSTSVTGHYLGGNLANNEYIAVRQVGYLGFTSVTTCLACASNWRGFSTNALLVGDKAGGKYLLVSITDTAIDRERVVVYKLVPQNNTWVHLTIADWFSYFKGAYKFKKWVSVVNDGSRLVVTGYFDAMDSSIHIEDYPRTVVVDLENLDFESTNQTNSQTTREATKTTIDGKTTNEQFNEDSTMQADKSKTTNDKYTLLELQKHTDRVKVSRNGDIAVTVKRLGDITDSSAGAVVHIYKTDASEDPFYCRVQSFNFELSSRSRTSLAVNEDGSIIAIGLPSSETDGHGKVTLWHRCPGSARWKEWEFLDNGGKLSFGRNVSFTNKGILQVEYDCGYAYFDVQSGRTAIQLSTDEPKEQPASDEFLDALKKKKEETSKLHKEGEEKIILLKVKNTELEQEIGLLNNLIELYSKKKR